MSIIRYSYPNTRSFAPALGYSRSPWTGLESEIDRLLSSALTGFAGTAPSQRQFPVDLHEDKDNVYVRAELPGVKREDINVETVEGYLTITASRKQQSGTSEESASFSRSVSVPDVQADKVSAAYENGVLTVTLPKREEVKPRKVTVEVK
jgi:HSP20 family protein